MALGARARQMSIGSVEQNGACAVAGVQGNLAVDCPDLDPFIVRILEKQFKSHLNERDLRMERIATDVIDWKDRYLDLTALLAETSVNDGLKRKAEDLLTAGKSTRRAAFWMKCFLAGKQSLIGRRKTTSSERRFTTLNSSRCRRCRITKGPTPSARTIPTMARLTRIRFPEYETS